MSQHYYTVYQKGNEAVYTGNTETQTYLQSNGFKEVFRIEGSHMHIYSDNINFLDGQTYMHRTRTEETNRIKDSPKQDLPLLIGSLKFPKSITLLEKRLKEKQ